MIYNSAVIFKVLYLLILFKNKKIDLKKYIYLSEKKQISLKKKKHNGILCKS